jgi:photosystem II stability/assembly factor-like uncharacterized protein
VARGDEERRRWVLSEPLLAGREVYHVQFDARHGTLWAATRHAVWGAHLHRSADLGRTWDVLPASPHHADERGMVAVWCVAPGPASLPWRLYAGIEPAGLFVSDDAGTSWAASPLNAHGTTRTWQPAGGALALHSIAIDPYDERRLWCAVSAGGVYRSDDAGASWRPANAGTRAEFLPDKRPEAGHCVHKLLAHPARPGRLYQQNHCGTYRSDDGGDSWIEITPGLPSDFGYVLATDTRDADTLFVVPEDSSHMRTTVGGRLRVYRTRDAGSSWEALTNGLPQEHAWVSLLRDAMTQDTLQPVGVYLGTSSGHVLASPDGGDTWSVLAEWLPRVLCLTALVV